MAIETELISVFPTISVTRAIYVIKLVFSIKYDGNKIHLEKPGHLVYMELVYRFRQGKITQSHCRLKLISTPLL